MHDHEEIYRVLGYKFNDPNLLELALNHRSVSNDCNERLEFLGDSILNFVIADAIFRKLPQTREGKLSRLRAHLVKGDTLADMAREFNLSKYIRLGLGEMKSGGAFRCSILSDALEAIIGAIYLDSNLESIRAVLLNWYESRLNHPELEDSKKDSKTRLQEYLQAHKMALPKYAIKDTKGLAHEQIFLVECRVEGVDFISAGEGLSRRKAEQLAAEKFYVWLQNGKVS